MTYGDYSFIPVPLMNINKEYQKSDDGTNLGTIFRVSLNGTLMPVPGDAGGLSSIILLQNQLRSGLNQEGCPFVLQCDSTVLWSGNPRISTLSMNESQDNWVRSTPYTVEMEFDDEPTDGGEDSSLGYISSASESWNVEFTDQNYFTWTLPDATVDTSPYVLRLTHNVSAKGKRHFTDCDTVIPAWQRAQAYVIPLLGYDDTKLEGSGVINLTVADFQVFDHMRTQTIDELSGDFSVVETWLVINPSGTGIPGNCTEDFTITARKSLESDINTVSIEGSIQGLETRSYGANPGDFSVTESKYAAASGCWDTINGRLYQRANGIFSNIDSTVRNLNANVVNSSEGHSLAGGSISYSYEYNDRPSNCITGSLFETITISDTNSNDIFASLVVLGRTSGPVLQDINTVSAPTRDVSIEVIMAPSTGCTAALLLSHNNPSDEVEVLIDAFEAELTGVYDQVFTQSDSEQWQPKEGRYSRNVSWIYENC